MPDIIEDGTGSGNKAHVDSENHLRTSSSMESMIAHRSHYDASAFGITTPLLTLTTTGGRVLYIKNTSTTHEFYLTDIWFSYDGGSATAPYANVMHGEMFFGDAAPSVNVTVGGAGNLNTSSSNTADLTVNYWDEVGDGMTGGAGGNLGFVWINTKGHNHVPVQGAVILGVNKSLGFNLKAIGEAGKASINIFGYMKRK